MNEARSVVLTSGGEIISCDQSKLCNRGRRDELSRIADSALGRRSWNSVRSRKALAKCRRVIAYRRLTEQDAETSAGADPNFCLELLWTHRSFSTRTAIAWRTDFGHSAPGRAVAERQSKSELADPGVGLCTLRSPREVSWSQVVDPLDLTQLLLS